MNDKNIVQLFFERSQQAITELSQKYGKLCFHIAMNILKCNEDAEECENDTYLKTWESIPPDDPMSLRAYVSRIVRNLALSKYRYNHRQMRDSHLQVYLSELQDCIPASQDVEASADDTVNRAIRAFLATQDMTARVLFIQRYFYMESISVLSKRFGLKESNISTKLNRTRKKLKQYLEREGVVL
ncbi:MAG: sigma-70 family RNA polymerase sigma factor [Lachnospiraceae bacterium]|nr:sigma-70 family RNA polymerase sigma factor [Lachnospiraceae bacterium]